MSLDEDLLKQLMVSFREELTERVAAINAGLLGLEQEPTEAQRTALLEELFRHVHSLKGAARAVSLKPIEELAHGMEDVFGAAKRGTISLSEALFDLLYQGMDLIGNVMANLDTGQGIDPALDLSGYLVRLAAAWRGQPIQAPQIEPTPAAPPPAEPAAPRPRAAAEPAAQVWSGETIRVPTTRLDDLMAQAGELLVTRLRVAQQIEELAELQALLTRWQKEWQRVRGSVPHYFRQDESGEGSLIQSFIGRNEEYLRVLADWLGQHDRRVADDATRLALVTDQLQEGIKRVRMLPLATLLPTFRRMIRDLARSKGVDVALEVEGGETEMDKHVLEQIKDPLMHLLRNCIDHGIEPLAERKRRGKPLRGTIVLRAERRANFIVVEVSDDGTGIDLAAVREAAARRGLIAAEAAAEVSEQSLLDLIFSSGLSTSAIITEVSGRGIGLDVVRKNVEGLQGRVEVRSARDQGTTFVLTLPFTLASTRCLLIRAGELPYAVPLSAVEKLVPVGPGDIAVVEGKEAVRYQGRPLALVRLVDVLRMPGEQETLVEERRLPAVILSAGGQRIAFLVDELLGEQELVVKNLGRQLARVPNIAGATILGTGQVVLILNALDLVKSAQRTAGPALLPVAEEKTAAQERKTILIVDDSITTRTLEKNILTTAGYHVRLALDGHEALSALSEGQCDLIVSDLDMPRMDGFELTRQLKGDERYRDLPVILVTSLDSPEDKAKGIEVGADAYIVKGAFDQDNLLETIRQLI
jgi:two-component system chemotaxis sensor kinase CheA